MTFILAFYSQLGGGKERRVEDWSREYPQVFERHFNHSYIRLVRKKHFFKVLSKSGQILVPSTFIKPVFSFFKINILALSKSSTVFWLFLCPFSCNRSKYPYQADITHLHYYFSLQSISSPCTLSFYWSLPLIV